MKTVIPLSILVLFLFGCADENAEDSNADWKIVNIQTKIDLHEVFFVNANVGFVAGKAPYELLKAPLMMTGVEDVQIITNSSQYYKERAVSTVPSIPQPSFFKTTDGGITWKNMSTPFVTTVTDVSSLTNRMDL